MWKRAKPNHLSKISTPKHSFSIVVAARNEEENLPHLLHSLSMLNYPKENFEIIIINDHSTDGTVEIVSQFPEIQILESPDSGKKAAIKFGTQQAQYEWIVQTDADCIVPPNWLQSLDQFILQNPNLNLISAPVSFTHSNFLTKFQAIDMLGFMAVTNAFFEIRQPILSNGANLCFKKSAYLEVQSSIRHGDLASGDDIFLLESISQKYPDSVAFLPNADTLVLSKPLTSISELILQRVRWGAKTGKIENSIATFILSGIALFYFSLIISCLYGLIEQLLLIICGIVWFLKIIADFILIQTVSKTLNQKFSIFDYFLSSIVHPFFILTIGIVGIFQKQVNWKDRTIEVR